jgi:glycosyltransferase involved in cell wall biosynthesis
VIRVLGLALYGDRAASTRQRLLQFAPGLRAEGIELEVCGLLGNDYLDASFSGRSIPWAKVLGSAARRLRDLARQGRFDLRMVHCELFPMMPGWLERVLLRSPYLYDFDDAFYLKYLAPRFSALSGVLGRKFDTVMEGAAGITAGNRTLAEFAQARNRHVTLLPTVVDTDRYLPAPKPRGDEFVVGWIGSPSTASYLSELVEPLAALGAEGPVRLVVVGGKAPAIRGVVVEERAWREDSEIEAIQAFDAGVMPLPDDDWARGKCAYKLIQYMACALPVVASRVGANVELVREDCGFLVSSAAEWVAALRTLRDNSGVGRAMGQRGRERIEAHYSLRHNLPILSEVIRQTVGRDV